MAASILWQNDSRTITLVDVPSSIAFAQVPCGSANERDLLSSPPSSSPFASNEPKSAAARAKLQDNTVDAELHRQYHGVLRESLEEIKKKHHGQWCLPRCFVEERIKQTKKRKLKPDYETTSAEGSNMTGQSSSLAELPTSRGHELSASLLADVARGRECVSYQDPPQQEGGSEEAVFHFASNTAHEPARLGISTTDSPPSIFRIPPSSSLYLGDCYNAARFKVALHEHPENFDATHGFDFILLDPPWPNRSVKRTHKTAGSTYSTAPSLYDIYEMIHGMALGALMAERCLVGIWITNKPAVRELMLGEDGLFQDLGLELEEEWLWLKTTVHGEPVTPLDALWRKPYEVLLLGRRKVESSERSSGDQRNETNSHSEDQGSERLEADTSSKVKRRVIVSVPDLHSRKPCLKALIEQLMQDSDNYQALEIFARHLVSGWWSWGDECLKFNWQGFWREKDQPALEGQVE